MTDKDFDLFPSPCYIMEEELLRKNLTLIKSVADRAGVEIILAFKSFAMWRSFPIFREYVEHSTASSVYEARLALEEFGSRAHTYSPAYTEADFPEIMRCSSHITFNSLAQFRRFYPMIQAAGQDISCGIRVNPEYSEVETELYNPCAPGTRFGVMAEQLPDVLPQGIDGFHCHCHCESSSYELERTLEHLEAKFSRWFPQIKWLNLGDRLVKLDELASDKGQGLDYKYYADRLLKEAELSKDDTYKGNALFQIIRYYYSRNIDSMYFFIKKAEPIYLAQKRYEDLCRVKGWYIYALSSNGEKERVLENVQALKDLSSELDFPDGIDMANQALADFYFSTGFDAEGIALYEEVFLDMEKRDSPLAKRITVIRHLQNENIQASKRLFYLKKLKEYIVECEEKGIEELDEDTPLYYVKYLYHRSYALLGIDKKDVSLTSYHLVRAEKLVKDCNMRNEYLSISNIRLLYYRISGDYERGKALANELIDYCLQRKRAVSVLGLMKDKAIICYNSGHGMEAADAYREYISLKDSVTNAAFYNDLANLRARHDVDKLELANKKMELEAAHSRTKLLVMGGGLVLLLLVCCSLGYISYSRHKYGLQLKQAKDKAEEADRLKSAFLANMNHEIRTPLNAIVGFSQVLVDEEDRETRQEFADIIQNNNELLQRLIADVLDLSKIESNSMPLIYKDQDIPTLMKEIYSMILLRMHEGVELELYDCEELVMETDRNRLTQILTNLLTNAIKHTQEGSIRFGYKRSALSVEFFVQDSGEGIPEDKIDTIFSRFVQLDNWSKGVGLGLAICQGLVEQMGGNIRVTSRVGEGSVFYVTLPLIRPRISS